MALSYLGARAPAAVQAASVAACRKLPTGTTAAEASARADCSGIAG